MDLFVWVITAFLAVSVIVNLAALTTGVKDRKSHGVALAVAIVLFVWGCVVLATSP